MSDQSDNERQPQVGSDGLVRLLPCPFCGNEGAFCDHDETGVMAGLRAHVECGNDECRAFGPDGHGKAEAEAKWNALRDPYEREAAKAAIHTLQRDLTRAERDAADWEGLANEIADILKIPKGCIRRHVGSAIINKLTEILKP